MQLLVISSKANDLLLMTNSCTSSPVRGYKKPKMAAPQCMLAVSVMEMLKQQYTSCMKVGTGRNLDLSREYHKKLIGPLFYSWWNCPLKMSVN